MTTKRKPRITPTVSGKNTKSAVKLVYQKKNGYRNSRFFADLELAHRSMCIVLGAIACTSGGNVMKALESLPFESHMEAMNLRHHPHIGLAFFAKKIFNESP